MANYCTPIDLVAHDSRTRLISQLAGNDYGQLPTPQQVKDYFRDGIKPDNNLDAEALEAIKARAEQAITNASGEINGLLAMCKLKIADFELPADTLTTINIDLALYRLCDNLDEDSVIRANAEKWIAMFNKLITGKTPVNTTEKNTEVATGSAETLNTTATTWTEDALNGY